ncbi:sugar isomerase [Treponema sp. HNW]|uniref:SIS domain-containing protein n=1 Tax=Treponema sp. HNW TaxID=3116654 RepID=UPI003D1156BB
MSNKMSEIEVLLEKPQKIQKELGYTNTAKEIMGQPERWLETLTIIQKHFEDLAGFVGKDPVLLLSGAGSSHYVSLSIQPALKKVFNYVNAIPSTEILMDPQSCFPRVPFILVSFARSGNSPEGNAVSELAEKLRPGLVKQIAFTCNQNGKLVSLINNCKDKGLVILLPEKTNDKSLAMTSSFSSMVIAGMALAYLQKEKRTEYASLVQSMAKTAQKILPQTADLAYTLSLKKHKRVFFVASRPFFGGAMESHLKIQELSGGSVIAKAEDLLGIRHGFMAAIDKTSLVLIFRSADKQRQLYEDDLINEICTKKLGKTIVVISDNEYQNADKIQVFVCGTAVNDDFRSVIVTLFGQLLGFFISLAHSLKPDAPSPDGVINRVVQGVTIHDN